MPIEIPARFGPLATVLLITTVVTASLSVDLLFTYTSLFALLFLAGVVAASYAGTMAALERFFDRESGNRRRDGHR